MLYFFHHYELPLILRQVQLDIFLRTADRQRPTSTPPPAASPPATSSATTATVTTTTVTVTTTVNTPGVPEAEIPTTEIRSESLESTNDEVLLPPSDPSPLESPPDSEQSAVSTEAPEEPNVEVPAAPQDASSDEQHHQQSSASEEASKEIISQADWFQFRDHQLKHDPSLRGKSVWLHRPFHTKCLCLQFESSSLRSSFWVYNVHKYIIMIIYAGLDGQSFRVKQHEII